VETKSSKQRYPRNSDCFSVESFEKLTAIMYDFKLKNGSYIFYEGDIADKLYYVQQGQIKLTKITNEGSIIVLFLFNKGDFIGNFDPFIDSTHSFSAVATEDCLIGVIQQRDLESAMRKHGELAVEFMRWMGLQNRMTQSKLRDLLLFGKLGALCSQLIRLNNYYGQKHGEYMLISNRLTNSELAEMIGSTRESVNRMLGKFKEEKIIEYENGCIVLKDIDYLKNIVQCENCPIDICRI
jgi:CRP-like cAMP-binding protein